MNISLDRLAFGSPHCPVCPLFLGQPVPVTFTEHGYALFCEVCALGHGAVKISVNDPKNLELRVDEAEGPTAAAEEE
jgi:hypothetical protein